MHAFSAQFLIISCISDLCNFNTKNTSNHSLTAAHWSKQSSRRALACMTVACTKRGSIVPFNHSNARPIHVIFMQTTYAYVYTYMHRHAYTAHTREPSTLVLLLFLLVLLLLFFEGMRDQSVCIWKEIVSHTFWCLILLLLFFVVVFFCIRFFRRFVLLLQYKKSCRLVWMNHAHVHTHTHTRVVHSKNCINW